MSQSNARIAANIQRRHNPVGKVFSRDELQAIGDLCVKHNIIILSDEVYLLLPIMHETCSQSTR